jgi:Mn2+/Fe2+ NRAMP family transporter
MLLLVNRPRLMSSFKNNRWQNGIAWSTAVIMILLTAAWVYTSVGD